jgi:hypothetical protein
MADVTLPDNATAGTPIAAVSVGMSDGSTFTGTLDIESGGMAEIVGNNILVARDLTSADGGIHTWSITATQDIAAVKLDAEVEIIPVPSAVLFDPDEISLPDNTAANFQLAEVSVEMSDGSAFAGSLVASPSSMVRMDGDNLILARGLTSADVGEHIWTVTTQD